MTVNDSSPLPITRGFVFLLFEPTISSSEFFYQTFLFLTIILLTDSDQKKYDSLIIILVYTTF